MNTQYIDSLILKLCKQPRSFEFISRNLLGLDPIELRNALNRLKKNGKINFNNDLWIIPDYVNLLVNNLSTSLNDEFLNQHIGYFNLYKKPHPLDFEWRNATATIDYLTELITTINSAEDSVLLLGMPTLFANACSKHLPNKFLLIDHNTPVINELQKKIEDDRFKAIDADIFNIDPLTLGKFSCVFMDPPWYSPHFYQFIWLASECLEIGGVLGISLPPINTRPSIENERFDWFKFCQRHGLSLENLYAQKLQYAMPFFEFNAFRAAGLDNVLPIWRKGDLALMRKLRPANKKRPILNEEKTSWFETEVNEVRIRVKVEDYGQIPNGIEINSIIKGDILPSVSTRDKRRKEANVWTSGNRIFKVNNSTRFIEYLKANADSALDSNEQNLVNDFLNAITLLEKEEYNNYLEWLYHEMERQID